jgi:hypothetical protein
MSRRPRLQSLSMIAPALLLAALCFPSYASSDPGAAADASAAPPLVAPSPQGEREPPSLPGATRVGRGRTADARSRLVVGTVTDEAGKPLADVEVIISAAGCQCGACPAELAGCASGCCDCRQTPCRCCIAESAKTNAAGEYSLSILKSALESGEIDLKFIKDDLPAGSVYGYKVPESGKINLDAKIVETTLIRSTGP